MLNAIALTIGSLLVLVGVGYLLASRFFSKTLSTAFQQLEEENERWWGI